MTNSSRREERVGAQTRRRASKPRSLDGRQPAPKGKSQRVILRGDRRRCLGTGSFGWLRLFAVQHRGRRPAHLEPEFIGRGPSCPYSPPVDDELPGQPDADLLACGLVVSGLGFVEGGSSLFERFVQSRQQSLPAFEQGEQKLRQLLAQSRELAEARKALGDGVLHHLALAVHAELCHDLLAVDGDCELGKALDRRDLRVGQALAE